MRVRLIRGVLLGLLVTAILYLGLQEVGIFLGLVGDGFLASLVGALSGIAATLTIPDRSADPGPPSPPFGDRINSNPPLYNGFY